MLDDLEPSVGLLHRRLAALDQARHACRAWGARAGVPVQEIKGLAISTLYEPGCRDMNDIDVMVPNVDDAWALAAFLRADGYDYYEHELPWLKRWAGQWLYGQITMDTKRADDRIRIDIHFGGYCVRHCGLLMPHLCSDAGRETPTTADALILLANNAHDACVRQKDLNDFYALLSRPTPSVDWPVFRAQSVAVGIAGYWTSFQRALRHCMRLDPATESTLESSLNPESGDEGVLPFGRYEWAHRRRIIIRHAAALGRPNLISAALNAFSAYTQYRRPRRVRVVRLFGSTGRCVRFLHARRCVRLVPQRTSTNHPDSGARTPIAGASLLRIVEAGRRTYVVNATGERFAPTIMQRLVRRGQPADLPYDT
jgi:hypothetical protein